MTAGRLESIQKDAYQEAWQKGLADGLKAGEKDLRERTERLDQLLCSLARPFEALDEEVERQLVDLSMTIVKQLFRREIRQNASHVIGVVREAIQLLPMAAREVQVHLHPDDAAIIRECLTPADGDPAWVIVEDPLASRGGCQIITENSRIDASAETRLNALIQSIVGDERQ